jgi:hypothetical protein
VRGRSLNGGLSPGPPKGNKNAFKHGRYTAEALARRREISELLRTMKAVARNEIWSTRQFDWSEGCVLYESGTPIRQLARALGSSPKAVRKARDRYGWIRTPENGPPPNHPVVQRGATQRGDMVYTLGEAPSPPAPKPKPELVLTKEEIAAGWRPDTLQDYQEERNRAAPWTGGNVVTEFPKELLRKRPPVHENAITFRAHSWGQRT